MYSIGWFSTGRGKGSQGLLRAVHEAIQDGDLPARIEFVFLSREPGETEQTDVFIRQVESYGIPLVYLSYKRYKTARGAAKEKTAGGLPRWRLEYDREVMELIRGFHPDITILAGYMLVVGPDMCRRYNMINLHPAAPEGPTGTWQEVIWQLIDARAPQTGVMMHLVTPQLDKGPVVTYATFPIDEGPFVALWRQIGSRTAGAIKDAEDEDNPLFKLIRQHGMARELPLVLATLKAFSSREVKVVDCAVLDGRGKAVKGYNLTAEIEERLKKA